MSVTAVSSVNTDNYVLAALAANQERLALQQQEEAAAAERRRIQDLTTRNDQNSPNATNPNPLSTQSQLNATDQNQIGTTQNRLNPTQAQLSTNQTFNANGQLTNPLSVNASAQTVFTDPAQNLLNNPVQDAFANGVPNPFSTNNGINGDQFSQLATRLDLAEQLNETPRVGTV